MCPNIRKIFESLHQGGSMATAIQQVERFFLGVDKEMPGIRESNCYISTLLVVHQYCGSCSNIHIIRSLLSESICNQMNFDYSCRLNILIGRNYRHRLWRSAWARAPKKGSKCMRFRNTLSHS